ncbi:hypothetical protein [Actinomadura madurae]|uniref:hypothetical protein n=1 Tax=Actinomadura madurae TaxID=1993 RepID=UPI000D84A1D8|nr:hypothetical protein [Actinomadura madurae]SPT51150.1 Uncharacterised protein [Actinomadura madurae]
MVADNSQDAARAEHELKVETYASDYLQVYTATIDRYYAAVLQELITLEAVADMLPVYGRRLGVDTGVVAAHAANDFYLFFVDAMQVSVVRLEQLPGRLDAEWTRTAADDRRLADVREWLNLRQPELGEPVNMPLTDFFSFDTDYWKTQAREHGTAAARRVGDRAVANLPRLRETAQRSRERNELAQRYRDLSTSKLTPQNRGTQFERLWRDLLSFHGWHPKKVRISGEDNDFTALYNGLHILGETRWFATPMTGGKMREFLTKLDTRPQTIGLFVSHSGYDDGALSVIRRSVATKTVVRFDRADIDNLFLHRTDLGDLFSEKLRDAYDYLSERDDQT